MIGTAAAGRLWGAPCDVGVMVGDLVIRGER